MDSVLDEDSNSQFPDFGITTDSSTFTSAHLDFQVLEETDCDFRDYLGILLSLATATDYNLETSICLNIGLSLVLTLV